MRRLRLTGGDDGFTIIEVMVASVILLVGILGVTTLVNTSNATITSNKAREQGLALAREIVESARSLRYQTLRPSTAVGLVQAMPGLGDDGSGNGWTLKRRGVIYSVSLGVCSVDDAGDGTGAHVENQFCARPVVQADADKCRTLVGTPAKIDGTGAGGPDAGDCGIDSNLDGQVDDLLQTDASDCPSGTSVAAGTCDAQPDDFKRIVVLVTWDRGSGSRYVLQQSTESFPGLSAYAGITKLELHGAGAPPSGGYVIKPAADGSNVSSLTFDAQSSESANRVDWLLDGTDMGQAAWSGTSGSFVWNLGNDAPAAETAPPQEEVLDGSYTIGARVQDAGGIHGSELDIPVTINRRKPFAPKYLSATVSGSTITLTWVAPQDLDVTGYVLHRVNGTNDTSITCPKSPCTDTPSSTANLTYYVAAVDKDPYTGQPREGALSNAASATTNPSASAPPAPASLTVTAETPQGANVWVDLSWAAVTFNPAVTEYGIWRDTTSGSPWATQTNGTTYRERIKTAETHQYWVAAKANGIYGPMVGPQQYPAP